MTVIVLGFPFHPACDTVGVFHKGSPPNKILISKSMTRFPSPIQTPPEPSTPLLVSHPSFSLPRAFIYLEYFLEK
ncbi:hypothetical protein CEXT_194981 [Caerostris extrusa]|uniref:Uncharacterized protein n=1 Tax=Caerostris extrusa TaxID=172846 RepID=A0AAV4M6K8_CAEEX|nr:hypothetical protein CEXT_194981 [Caerostris extrusa]